MGDWGEVQWFSAGRMADMDVRRHTGTVTQGVLKVR
jgi:hypothetical protein